MGVPGPAPPRWPKGWQHRPRPLARLVGAGAERSVAEPEQHAGARPHSWRLEGAPHHSTRRASWARSVFSWPEARPCLSGLPGLGHGLRPLL